MNPEGTLGGAERSLVDVLWSFRKTRPDIALGVLLGGDGPLVDETKTLGVETFQVRLPEEFASLGENAFRLSSSRETLTKALSGSAALAAHVAQVNRTIREFRPTVIHTNGVKSHVVAALAAPSRVPLVWHVRDFLSERRLGSRLLRALSWRPKLAIANSQAVADDIKKIFPKLRAHVVLNGVDTEKFDPIGDAAPLEELAQIDPDPTSLRVGLVATFARWKGQELFLEAARVVRDRPTKNRIRFFIVGGAVYRTAKSQLSETDLRAQAAALGISNDVGFIPFQNDPASVFRALDIVVHASSRPEPFGRTIVEAMACGRAVIGVAEGGAREILLPEKNALTFDRGNAQSLADAIVRLANDEALRARLGEEGRRDAVARFSRDRLAADMLRAYLAMSD